MIIPDFYEHCCPTKLMAGQMALSNLTFEMKRFGCARAMVVIDKSVAATLLARKLQQAFIDSDREVGCLVDDVPAHSASLRAARRVAGLFRRHECDCFVAVGSGNAMNVVKVANIMVAEGSDDPGAFAGRQRIKADLSKMFAVPVAFTPEYQVSNAAVVYDEEKGRQLFFADEQLYPVMAVLDNKARLNMPPGNVAGYGLDALSLALEGYFAADNPVVTIYARGAIELVRKYLVRAVNDARAKEAVMGLLNAACYAGIAFSHAQAGVVQAAAWTLNQMTEISRAEASAILLPFYLDIMAQRQPEKLRDLAGILAGAGGFVDEERQAARVAETVRRLCVEAGGLGGLPQRLSDGGVAEKQLAEVAALTVDKKNPYFAAGPFSAEDVALMIRRAF